MANGYNKSNLSSSIFTLTSWITARKSHLSSDQPAEGFYKQKYTNGPDQVPLNMRNMYGFTSSILWIHIINIMDSHHQYGFTSSILWIHIINMYGFTSSCTCTVPSGHLHSVEIFYSIQWFCLRTTNALIRLHWCAG